MEPTIKVVSILSMTPEQDIRVQQALGEYANAVIKEADVIFQGSVNSLNYVVANNIYNKPMIYTDMSLKVEDRLRGEIENPDNFPFRMIGGSVGNKSLDVKGMPEFSSNEIFLLFLKKENENYSVVSGEKGKVSISGSVELKTDKTKWDGLSPIVKVFVNPNISTISSENYLSNIKQSILQWFLKGKSNFGFLYDNITSNDKPTSAESIDCNISSLIGSKITTVYPVNMYDKDCTDTSCVFLWKCNQYILSSDIQINTHNYKWTLHQPTQIDEYSLPHEILHNLGHVAGLEHCKVGDTISMCNSRLSTNQIEPISTDVMYKFSNNIVPISENDIGQLQSLYGVLNLPFQQEGKYVLDEDDILNILSMMDMENVLGLNTKETRKTFGASLKNLAIFSERETGKSLIEQYNEYIEHAIQTTPIGTNSDLQIAKNIVTYGIYTANRLKDDSLKGLNSWDISFIDHTINKQLELRRVIIDELNRRGL